MAIPTIFQRIKESVKVRKKAKKEIEEVITLNSKDREENNMVHLSTSYRFADSSNRPIRMIDEGAVFYEGGNVVRFFIKKGVIQKFYDELDDDFVGYINLAHFDVYAFPIFLGTWTKEDLSIVDLEDGRQGLNVIPHFNEDLYLVKDLFAQEIPLSISIEAWFDYDWDMTDKLQFPVVDGIEIDGFSVVGNPANTSSAYVLSSEKGEESNMDLSKIKAILESSETEEKETNLESTEAEEETENLETKEKEVSESVESSSEETEENTSETLESEETDEDEEKAILDLVTELVEQNKALKAEIEALKAEKENQTQKTESVISKLESIVNGTPAKTPKKSTTDSVWG